MNKERPLSSFAARSVERKLVQWEAQSRVGTGQFGELARQNFTDGINALLATRVPRPELRVHIMSEAKKTGQYMGDEQHLGRWTYDVEHNAPRWRGETPDALKTVDAFSEWRTKSTDERARYVFGHFGNDQRTQNNYPGIQVEKNGVVGPVKWGPEQPTATDAHEHAQKMLDRHLKSPARQSAELSSEACRKYAKPSVAPQTSAAKKYGEIAANPHQRSSSQGRAL